MVGRISVTGQLPALDPVGDGEVEGRARGEMHDCHACGLLAVFFDEHDGSVLTVGRKLADFSQRILVAVAMGGARNIGAVGEEGGEEMGLGVDSRDEGCCNEDLGVGGGNIGKECGKLEGK